MTKTFLIAAAVAALFTTSASAQRWDSDNDRGRNYRGDDYGRHDRDDDYGRRRRDNDDYGQHRRRDDDDYGRRRSDWPRDDYGSRNHGPVIIVNPSRPYPDRNRYPDRDSDHDGIPDRYDRTPYGERTTTNRYPDRLPDRDRDGIPDYRDRTDNRYPQRRPEQGPWNKPGSHPSDWPANDAPRQTNKDKGGTTTTGQDNTPEWYKRVQEEERQKNKGGGTDGNKSGDSGWKEGSGKKDPQCDGYGKGTPEHPCP